MLRAWEGSRDMGLRRDVRLLFVTWLLVNRIPFEDIVRMYDFSERDLLKYFIRLRREITLQSQRQTTLVVNFRHFSFEVAATPPNRGPC
jgi:hypothetical protein